MGTLEAILLGIAAAIIAINQALKDAPVLSARLPAMSPRWNYLPAVLVAAAAVIYIVRPTQAPDKDNHAPAKEITEPVKPYVMPPAKLPLKFEPLIDVGDLAGTPRAAQLHTMSNADLGAEAQAIAIQIADLRRSYSNRRIDLDFSDKLPALQRVKKKADLVRGLDSEFRAKFANDALLLQRELSIRAVAANKPLIDVGAIKVPQSQLSDGQIEWIAVYLRNWGHDVQDLGSESR